jgi:hypothetical protein
MVVIIIKYIKSEDFIMNPLVAAASIIAGLSVGLAAGPGWTSCWLCCGRY